MYSIVVEEFAKSILAQMENTSDLELFALQEVISKYSKIFYCTGNMRVKKLKRTWRIRREYFTVFSLYASRHKFKHISATKVLDQNRKDFTVVPWGCLPGWYGMVEKKPPHTSDPHTRA
jgi:hypothetical protein